MRTEDLEAALELQSQSFSGREQGSLSCVWSQSGGCPVWERQRLSWTGLAQVLLHWMEKEITVCSFLKVLGIVYTQNYTAHTFLSVKGQLNGNRLKSLLITYQCKKWM